MGPLTIAVMLKGYSHCQIVVKEKESVLVTQSCVALRDPVDCVARFLCPWDSVGKNTGVGCHFLLQGILLTQGSNLGLLHCRQILYHLSHQGNRKKRGISALPLPSSAGSLESPTAAGGGPVRQRTMCASVCVCVVENTHHPLAAGAFQCPAGSYTFLRLFRM